MTSTNEKVFLDLPYVTNGGTRRLLDLYVPESGGPFPVLIWIHGGAWLYGCKSDGVPREYVEQGYAVASLNYRLSSEAIFPAQIKDCKAAVRWLRANAGQYRLDPNRIGAWGASAGGHLVALLGTTGGTRIFDVGENLEFSSEVQAVVDYFGPTDFMTLDDGRTDEQMLHHEPNSPESKLIGGMVTENEEKVKVANPIT